MGQTQELSGKNKQTIVEYFCCYTTGTVRVTSLCPMSVCSMEVLESAILSRVISKLSELNNSISKNFDFEAVTYFLTNILQENKEKSNRGTSWLSWSKHRLIDKNFIKSSQTQQCQIQLRKTELSDTQLSYAQSSQTLSSQTPKLKSVHTTNPKDLPSDT